VPAINLPKPSADGTGSWRRPPKAPEILWAISATFSPTSTVGADVSVTVVGGEVDVICALACSSLQGGRSV
jgi:hypothetical protein